MLLERMPEVELAVSATTREQRPGEQNGREYWFITPEKFERLVEEGSSSSTSTFRGGRGRARCAPRSIASRRTAKCRSSTSRPTARCVCRTRSRDRSRSSSTRRLRGARAAPARAGNGELRRDPGPARPCSQATNAERPIRLRDRQRGRGAGCGGADGNRPSGTPDRRYHEPPMIHPRIDELLENVDSRYALVIVAAKRARQINDYHHQLGEGIGFDQAPPPLVESRLEELLDHGPRGSRRGQAQVQVPEVASLPLSVVSSAKRAEFRHGSGTRRHHRWDRRL